VINYILNLFKKENEKTKQNTKKPVCAVIDNTLRRAVYVYSLFIDGTIKIKSNESI